MDPDLQIDIITELDLVNTTIGVTQVPGLHNASKAFLFQGKTRVLDSLSPVQSVWAHKSFNDWFPVIVVLSLSFAKMHIVLVDSWFLHVLPGHQS